MAPIEDDETLRLYIEESQEHLNGIENDLLKIEADGAEIDLDLVNKVFRAVHSIKGGAGFLGLVQIKELAHALENILNLIRKKELLPESEVMNVMLEAFDQLTQMVDSALTSNEVEIATIIERLQRALSREPVPAPEEKNLLFRGPGGEELFQLSAQELKNAQRGGKALYLLCYDVALDLEARGKSAEGEALGIESAGTLLARLVREDQDGRRVLYALYATVLETFFMDELTGLAAGKIFLYDEHLQLKDIPKEDFKESSFPDELPDELPSAAAPAPEPPVVESRVQPAPPAAPVAEASAPAPPPRKEAPPRAPEPAAVAAAPASSAAENRVKTGENFLRVNVNLLDSLMRLAGELVLTRNQLVQNVNDRDLSSIEDATQRLSLITTDVQEAIMTTRMQPVGTVFTKFHRVIRDMSRTLGKEINLVLEGEEVDLDKTIIEAITDPLTHLVRNSADHGLETPEQRQKAGKNPVGTLKLSASHEAGQVNILVQDDGRGIDHERIKKKAAEIGLVEKSKLDKMSREELVRLIFAPGFSTADKVTDVSGRGVGMDVVQTNLAKLSGDIDVQTELGKGTTIRMKLPLTLAIIPSLIVDVELERCAIPQVNLEELVRVAPAEVKSRIETIGNAEVIRLRGELLPLVRLADVLGLSERTFEPEDGGERFPDRRRNIADRRGPQDGQPAADNPHRRLRGDRRRSALSSYNIAVVAAGEVKFGLIVDRFLDSEEIVVKPLGRHLKDCRAYAGATIQGDGRISLILDIPGISRIMNLSNVKEAAGQAASVRKTDSRRNAQTLLIVNNAPGEQFAVPLGLITRIERVGRRQIETLGNRRSLKYRGGSLPVVSIEDVARVNPREDLDHVPVIVFQIRGREVGLVVARLRDVVDVDVEIDQQTFHQEGILGSAIILGETTLLVDIFQIVRQALPEWSGENLAPVVEEGERTILVVEDSDFFRKHIKSFLEESGYRVLDAADGLLGFQELDEHAEEVCLVLTDIEMPNLDGVGLTEKIRKDGRFDRLPVIAVTSLAGEAAEKRGIEAGINEYMIKLDREQILDAIHRYVA
ncbi:chemotaxis protein CheW [bacterium]|nr:chemotaxis protein CheW [bacterium]